MPNFKCISCGKVFDPERYEICPRCGAAVAPSVLTRIERKRTARRLRAEGKTNYDEHCHEDDAWKASYGAGAHREAVRAHERTLRDSYASHSAADNRGANPTRVSNANPARTSAGRKRKKNLGELLSEKPYLILLVFLIPVVFFFASLVLTRIVEILNTIGGIGSFVP